MGLILSGAALWLMCGVFAAYLASQKRRSGAVWFFIGLLCGPIGLIAAAGVPSVERDGDTEDIAGNRETAGGLEDLQTSMTRE